MRRRAPFVALQTSLVISVAGTSMSAIAIPWLVLTTTGSAAKTGLVGFATMMPYVAAQALAGPLVDRIGLRRSFVWGNSVAAVVVGAIPVLYAAGGLTLPALLTLVALAGLVRGAADCANSALVPATAGVGGITLERAAGVNAAAHRTALLLGAPLAGVLVTLAGSPVAVAVDAATFAAAAAIGAIWVRVAEQPTVEADTEAAPALRRYWHDLTAGLRFVAGDRLLLGIITMVALTNLLDQGLIEVMLPVWVRDEVGSAGALGVIVGVGGLGAVLGNLVGAWLGPRVSRRALYTVGFILGGAPRFFVLAMTGTLSPVVAVVGVAEVFAGSLNAVIGTTSYERIPEELRARVLGAVRASAWIGTPFGALVGGYAVEALDVHTALLVFGAAYLITTLAPVVFPAWRQMRRPDPLPADERHDVAVP
ncbi:MFS transporter [Planosporangium sp. 12N6]|uniref:MFS transporter n=1 Tax=Planosporangium spinosum TaxID=3402278 RepID=UPI003CF3674F